MSSTCPTPAVGARGLYAEVVSGLGGEPRFHKAFLIDQVASILSAEAADGGRDIVLVVDEAHLLDDSQLVEDEAHHERRDRTDSANPFALVLLGQPALRSRLRLGRVDAPAFDGSRYVMRYRR